MTSAATGTDLTWLYWAAAGLSAVLAVLLFIIIRKGRRLPGAHVFKASRLSRGNAGIPSSDAMARLASPRLRKAGSRGIPARHPIRVPPTSRWVRAGSAGIPAKLAILVS